MEITQDLNTQRDGIRCAALVGPAEPEWTYSRYRASLYRNGKQFAIVTPNCRDALTDDDINTLLAALNGPTAEAQLIPHSIHHKSMNNAETETKEAAPKLTPDGEGLAGAPCSALLRWAKLNDVTVARMLRGNEPMEHIVGVLAREKEQYAKRIMELEMIAPRKIVLPDGKVMLWQCPQELVPPMMPNEKLSNPEPRSGGGLGAVTG